MMLTKRLALLLACACVAGAPGLSQDVPALEPDYAHSGFSASLWHTDLSGLNDALTGAGYFRLPGHVMMFGEETTIGFVDGPRVGLIVASGSACSRVGDRIARLSLTFGSGLLEWGLTTAAGRSIAFGLTLGGGTSTLTLVDHLPGSFEEALKDPFRAKLDRWLYIIEPSASAQGSPFEWLDLKLRVGYLMTIGCDWKAEETAYRYPMSGLGGPLVEVSAALHLERLVHQALEEEAGPSE
jgi:hypothetical protein